MGPRAGRCHLMWSAARKRGGTLSGCWKETRVPPGSPAYTRFDEARECRQGPCGLGSVLRRGGLRDVVEQLLGVRDGRVRIGQRSAAAADGVTRVDSGVVVEEGSTGLESSSFSNSNTLIVCGTPSSVRTKSSLVMPSMGLPSLSVTVTVSTTNRVCTCRVKGLS